MSSGRALELFLTTHFEEAVAAQEQALRCCEELGDPVGQAAALTFLAQLRWQVGSLPEALTTAQHALDLLEGSRSPNLVGAYQIMAVLLLAAYQLRRKTCRIDRLRVGCCNMHGQHPPESPELVTLTVRFETDQHADLP